jgi:hypothetical protein
MDWKLNLLIKRFVNLIDPEALLVALRCWLRYATGGTLLTDS